jgi:hypothetical protein
MSSPAQYMDALALANQVRTRQAKVRRRLRALSSARGVAEVARLIEREDEGTLGLTVSQALLSCRGFGPTALRCVCRHAGIVTADRKMRELTDRQRRELVHVLRSPGVLPPRFMR